MNIKTEISNIMSFRMKHVDLARNKPNKFKTKAETEFSAFNEKYPQIFRLCLQGFFDNPAAINQLESFINLSEKVNNGEAKVGFALFATQMENVINFADKKLNMPPKSTWFDPKPLDGLVAYDFE